MACGPGNNGEFLDFICDEIVLFGLKNIVRVKTKKLNRR